MLIFAHILQGYNPVGYGLTDNTKYLKTDNETTTKPCAYFMGYTVCVPSDRGEFIWMLAADDLLHNQIIQFSESVCSKWIRNCLVTLPSGEINTRSRIAQYDGADRYCISLHATTQVDKKNVSATYS